jgi:pimeloyl-ACP methyl ester carboxylesterase
MSLYVHESGTVGAPAILFLHAIGTSGWMWQQQVAALQDFHCLVPDLPGHGQSARQPWVSLAATATELAEVVRRHTAQGQAHIVGLSLGSYVGLQLMSARSDVVDHAVLSGLNVLPLPHLFWMNLLGVVLLPVLKTDRMIRMNATGLRVPTAQYAGYRHAARQLSRRAYLRASSDAGRFQLPPNLADVPCPTLVVAGEHEHVLIRQSLRVVTQALPNAHARVAPGVGHGWSGENPTLFTQTIQAWITDTPLPADLQTVP